MRVVVGREASNELREARRRYAAEAGVKVAGRFIAEFERLRVALGRAPETWPEIEPGIRRVLFRARFPYSLIYVIRDHRVVIVALMHQHREPGYWKGRDL